MNSLFLILISQFPPALAVVGTLKRWNVRTFAAHLPQRDELSSRGAPFIVIPSERRFCAATRDPGGGTSRRSRKRSRMDLAMGVARSVTLYRSVPSPLIISGIVNGELSLTPTGW